MLELKNVVSLFDGMGIGLFSLIKLGFRNFNYCRVEIDKKANDAFFNYFNKKILDGFGITVIHYDDVKNFPHNITSNLDYIEKLNKEGTQLLLAGSPCFTKENFVLTSEGLKCISNVRVGDEVLTHKNRWQKVLKIGGKKSKTINLDIYGMPITRTTENHPFLTQRRVKKWNNDKRKYEYSFEDAIWKHAKDIEIEDYVMIPIIKEEYNKYNLTDEECFVLGRYLADGHTRKDLRKEKGRSPTRYWQLILSIGAGKEFDTTIKHNLYKHTKNVKRMVFSSKRLVEIAEKELGCGASNKFISTNLLKLPTYKLKKLLEGYLSGYGSKRENEIRVNTVSKTLSVSLQIAFAKTMGIVASLREYKVSPQKTIEGRLVNQKEIVYELCYRENPKFTRFYKQENYILVPFKTKNTGEDESVYNLEVENDNSYTINGCYVHNCQGFSVAGKQLNFNDPRSKLFFEFLRIKNLLNPQYFLLENVKMKKEFSDVIDGYIGSHHEIDSADYTAQTRKRLYWTNIEYSDEECSCGLTVEDILEDEVDDKYFIEPHRAIIICDNECAKRKIGFIGTDSMSNRIYSIHGKSITLTANAGGLGGKTGLYALPCLSPDRAEKRQNGIRFKPPYSKFYTLTTIDRHGVIVGNYIRKLTPRECERLQGWPDDMTIGAISDSARYKICGNGWTEPVIRNILSYMPLKKQK